MARTGAFFTKEQDKELERLLKQFGPAVAKRPLARSLREAQKIITTEAKATAPRGKTGQLKKAIKTRALPKRGRAGRKSVAFATTVSEKHMPERYYASFIELGAKGRNIEPREFFRQAFDRKENEAARKFISTLDQAIAFIWKSGGKLTGFRAGA